MNRIDLYGEKIVTYNADGTITAQLRNCGEPSVEITVSREQEFALKDLLRMIESRNENIETLETVIAALGKAHSTEAETLEGETKEVFEANSFYKWEKKVAELRNDDRDRAA